MKKLTTGLFILFSTALFFSCSKENPSETTKDLVGIWESHTIISHYYINEELKESDTSRIIYPDYFNITLKKNKEFLLEENTRWNESYEGIYNVNGNKLSLWDKDYEPDEYTFVLKGNELTLTLVEIEGTEMFRYKYVTEFYLTKK